VELGAQLNRVNGAEVASHRRDSFAHVRPGLDECVDTKGSLQI
jgi:hypothetical protein